jgi:peptidoglycan biosynthesis protein MviN/MurJ (putative lipid II flippase)
MAWSRAKWRAVMLDFLERAGWSAGQVFFATLLAGGTADVGNLPWKYSSTLALGGAVSSIILTAVQYLTRLTDLPFWPDQVVRLLKTFLASLAASIVAAGVFDVTTFNWTTAINVAALATITALGKGLLARGQTTVAGAQTTAATPPPQRHTPSTLPFDTYENAVRR